MQKKEENKAKNQSEEEDQEDAQSLENFQEALIKVPLLSTKVSVKSNDN